LPSSYADRREGHRRLPHPVSALETDELAIAEELFHEHISQAMAAGLQ
jgi:hypothetical protein